MRWVLPMLFLIGGALPSAVGAGVSFPAATRPSYASGSTLYRQHCTTCHGVKPDFFQERWREAHSPSDITGAALGFGRHPSVLTDPLAAWHVTAYVWSAHLSPEIYRLGEALVLEAESHLKRSGLLLLLSKGKVLSELLDANWVMNHTEADILANVQRLVGTEMEALSEAARDALVAYIYSSHFDLPWFGIGSM